MKRFLCRRRGASALLVSVLVIFLASASTYAAPPAAPAGEIAHYRLKSSTAYASWNIVDPTQCTTTSAYLFVSDSATLLDTGGKDAQSVLTLQLYQWNSCTSSTVIDGWSDAVSLPAEALQVKGSAFTLSATPVPLYDNVTGTTLNLTVSAAWTATSGASRNNSSGTYSAPGYHFHYHTVGTYREASATANVMLGASNCTPGPSEWGSTSIETIGNMSISHP